MKISIYAPYAKERYEQRVKNCILHPERIVGNPEVIPRNAGEERALPQSNSVKTFVMARAAPVPGSGKRLEKFINSDEWPHRPSLQRKRRSRAAQMRMRRRSHRAHRIDSGRIDSE
jgi:hypothetical protein